MVKFFLFLQSCVFTTNHHVCLQPGEQTNSCAFCVYVRKIPMAYQAHKIATYYVTYYNSVFNYSQFY